MSISKRSKIKIISLGMVIAFVLSAQPLALSMDTETESVLRQQERGIAAEHAVRKGIDLYKNKDFDAAKIEFTKALQLDPENRDAQKYMDRVDKELAKEQTYLTKNKFKAAISNYKAGNYKRAAELFTEVLNVDPNYPGAQEYLQKCDNQLVIMEKQTASEGITIQEINQIYEKGKVLYENSRYEEARDAFSEVIAYNPNHVPALRYIDACNEKIRTIVDDNQITLNKEEMITLRKSWFPKKDYSKDEMPEGVTEEKPKEMSAAREKIEKELDQIIPLIDFTNAHLRDLITSLSGMSGVNIILDESVFPTQKAAEEVILEGDVTAEQLLEDKDAQELAELEALLAEEVGETGETESVETSADGTPAFDDTITISLRNIPLREALKYIVKAKGLKYRVDDYAVVISTPENLTEEQMETKYYHLKSGTGAFTSFIHAAGDTEAGEKNVMGGNVSTEQMSIKDVLEQSGVPWPEGSKIFLHERTSTLIARNTPTNLAIIDDILRVLDVTALQVEIEAKFLDLNEVDASELGLEWMLTNDWHLTTDGQDRGVTMDANSLFPANIPATNKIAAGPGFGQYPGGASSGYGITRGLRFLQDSTGNPLGNVLSLSGVLTSPEFQIVIHALSQDGRADVLSSPRVVTLNNQEATIRVVTELIYPTEYEITPPTWDNTGAVITSAGVAPGGFETREIGVILKVIPNVGADNKTINLAIIPEVSELSDWINYGIIGYNVDLPQPVISTRLVTTNVIINDGETIVLGGLMRETAQETDDKVPILGDIPFLGRLFKNETESNSKRNLIIFVTANLLTPTGEAFAAEQE
ncbi:MAG: tetratricopeptide repeat protein [Candidatus Aureabacteria bacterium]|nr:tetratricopeptide repeat protein [Candidatus Auribacterota bacterium]